MNFSLRTLLLLFPLFMICYGISFAAAYFLFEPVNAASDLGAGVYQQLTENYLFPADDLPEVDVPKLNLWLNDQLPSSDPHYRVYQEFFVKKQDPWGRRFQAVALNAAKEPAPSLAKPVWIAAYSLGPDGISKSAGNDPDDISPWRKYIDPTKAERIARQRQRVHVNAAIMSPILFGLVIVVFRYFTGGKVEDEI